MSGLIICCLNCFYVDEYCVLIEVGYEVFGVGIELIIVVEVWVCKVSGMFVGNEVVLFGKWWGGEFLLLWLLCVDGGKVGSYYVDWIVVKIDVNGEFE